MDFFTLPVLIAFVVGALFGVGLGMRSNTARQYYVEARKRADEARAKLAAEYERLRDQAGA